VKKQKAKKGKEDTTLLYLARHGQVVNDGVYNGQNNVDITPLGVKQMERLRDLLQDKKITAVYSSDLLRTQRGADMIGAVHGLNPQYCPEFREMHFGRWQGLSYKEVSERYPSDIPQWLEDLEHSRVPEGESLCDAVNRAVPKLRELVEKHQGEEILLVCHGALNRVILAEALQLPVRYAMRIEQDYGCLNIIEYGSTWTAVKLMNG
jgi:alpha-ribazole phosphatase